MSNWKRAESSTCTGELGILPEWLYELAVATLPLVGLHRPPPERKTARGVRGMPWHGDSWVGPQRRSGECFPRLLFPGNCGILSLGVAALALVAWCRTGSGWENSPMEYFVLDIRPKLRC